MKVENEELLPIGRFSLLTGLTAKALRHYDDVGLLRRRPAEEEFPESERHQCEQHQDAEPG